MQKVIIMYELIQVSPNNYYIDCPSRMGVIRVGESEVVMIDGGSDKDAGKKALRIFQANGWTLKAICNTHSHADHTGGNAYLHAQTGCKIYAPGVECDFVNHTVLEPACLYGGFPLEALRHKFLMAQPSPAEPLTQTVLPEGVELIALPGHSFDMVGFRTSEGTVYLADCLCAEETLKKYGLSYLWDVQAYLDTLEKVKEMRAKCFVPAHVSPTDDIAPLAQINIDAVHAAAERILSLCAQPAAFEEILRGVFIADGTQMSAQSYALTGSTVRSYLAWLQHQGRADFAFEDNRMLWQAK